MNSDYQIISGLLAKDSSTWRKHDLKGRSKSQLLACYRQLVHEKRIEKNTQLEKFITMKPIRTLSGVTPVTVLTKPYPCPGECVFCPSDVRMPKSYIASEPGAQRAGQHAFDPYTQVMSRLQTYSEIGHDIGKVELIVLGGTWSVYPESYQIWFIKRLFQALNEFGKGIGFRVQGIVDLNDHIKEGETYNQHVGKSEYIASKIEETATWDELIQEHKRNENAKSRCVGLVLETRPDYVTNAEVLRLRRLGATKIQIGIQSINDQVLELNKRGHTVAQTIESLKKLRLAGFKIHAHWMANLYGNNVNSDIEEYRQLFELPEFRPDELKIYPCSLIPDTELVTIYNSGKWHPYEFNELAEVLRFCLTHTPEYCRLTRIIRDIPSQEIMAGNKHTNFRQMVAASVEKKEMHDIRSREIGNQQISVPAFVDDVVYSTLVSEEHFIQYITLDRKIVAFLRLSLPKTNRNIEELRNCAMIREVHVYGQAVSPGVSKEDVAQHRGYGTKLISQAIKIAKRHGYATIAVISAIGTREYYRKLGFSDGMLYQHLRIDVEGFKSTVSE